MNPRSVPDVPALMRRSPDPALRKGCSCAKRGCLFLVLLAFFLLYVFPLAMREWELTQPNVSKNPSKTRYAKVESGATLRIDRLPTDNYFYGGVWVDTIGVTESFRWQDDQTLVLEMSRGGRIVTDHNLRLWLQRSRVRIVVDAEPLEIRSRGAR